MNVSWEKLSLEEARGYITGYTIRYDTIGTRNKRNVRMEVVDPDSLYKVIGDLGFTESYSVTVSANTAVGEGISSTVFSSYGKQAYKISYIIAYCMIIPTAPSLSTFQLKITGVYDCFQWRVS